MGIVKTEEVLGGEPRIEGTRIGVRHVASRVLETGSSMASVADQFDISLADVYEAMAYYYSHADEIREIERRNEAAFEKAKDFLKPRKRVS